MDFINGYFIYSNRLKWTLFSSSALLPEWLPTITCMPLCGNPKKYCHKFPIFSPLLRILQFARHFHHAHCSSVDISPVSATLQWQCRSLWYAVVCTVTVLCLVLQVCPSVWTARHFLATAEKTEGPLSTG